MGETSPENKGQEQELKVYENFDDFYRVLDGVDNINLVDFKKGHQGNSEERRNFVRQLLEKTGLNRSEGLRRAVSLFDVGRIQTGVYQKGGKLLIKEMKDEILYTHEIDKDFNVSSKSVWIQKREDEDR